MVKPQCQYTQRSMCQRKPAQTPTCTHTHWHAHTHTHWHAYTHTHTHTHTDMHTHTHTLTCTHTHTHTHRDMHTHRHFAVQLMFSSHLGLSGKGGCPSFFHFSIFRSCTHALRAKTDQSSRIKAPLIKYLPRIGVRYWWQVSGRSLFLE